jgi:hypothetical protein
MLKQKKNGSIMGLKFVISAMEHLKLNISTSVGTEERHSNGIFYFTNVTYIVIVFVSGGST